MKIAIIHLSDFHIQENCRICSAKLNALVSALSVLGNVDHYVIAFSGDLAASGKINEYRTARTFFWHTKKGKKCRLYSAAHGSWKS